MTQAAQNNSDQVQHMFVRVRDGLKLHVSCYLAQNPTGRPAVCLPGLTRNGRDFHDLAYYLSTGAAVQRDVYTIDYRGRGLSEWDTNWKNYAVPIEALDVLDILAALNLHNAAFIGTSRGGLIMLVIAGLQPTVMGAAILNDVGPVVETDGLIRIMSYVGRVPLPRNWADATKSVRDLNRKKFPAIPDDMWEDVARQWYNDKNDRPTQGYDPELKNALSVLDGPMPSLWPQYQALTRVPVMVLRGEHSDILSEKTVEQMRKRHPVFESFTVPGQGHAPLLKDTQSQTAISDFLIQSDQAKSAQQRQPPELDNSPKEGAISATMQDTNTTSDHENADASGTPGPNRTTAHKRRPLVDRL